MAKRSGGFPGMGGNMNQLMKQAQKMQKQMEETTKALEESTYEATAGGGVVKVVVSGKKEVVSVHLEEEVVDPDDVEMLEDLIVAATNEALRKMEEDSQEKMGKVTKNLGNSPELDLNPQEDWHFTLSICHRIRCRNCQIRSFPQRLMYIIAKNVVH